MTKTLFDPDGGEFAENIRSIVDLNDKELRASMKEHGWIEEFPALADENGVILVGNRRMKIAEELNIEVVVKTIEFGSGTDADAKRVQIAVASNIGGKQLSKDDRKRIAEVLYRREWTMERIAQALGVTKMTISRALDGCNTLLQPSRPKGGRPKGSGKKKGEALDVPSPELDKARQIVRPFVEEGLSISREKLSEEHGISEASIQKAQIAEKARKEALEEEPQVTREMLSLSAQEKLDAAIKRERKKLERELESKAREISRRAIEETVLPAYNKEREEWRDVIKRRDGMMTKAEYNLIKACLHPDDSMTGEKRRRAFDLVSQLEITFLSEKDRPTSSEPIPKTYEEMMALKRQRSTARRSTDKSVSLSESFL